MQTRSVRGGSALFLPLMVAAVAAGAVAGLLLAPMSGSAFRSRARSYAGNAGARLRTYAASIADWARPSIERARTGEPSPGNAVSAPLTATVGELAAVQRADGQQWEPNHE